MFRNENKNLRKVSITVTGRVQGIGFRYATKKVADKLGVAGYVWNNKDGGVTIEAIAYPTIIDKFLNIIQNSPTPNGFVETMDIQDDDSIPDANKFNIVIR